MVSFASVSLRMSVLMGRQEALLQALEQQQLRLVCLVSVGVRREMQLVVIMMAGSSAGMPSRRRCQNLEAMLMSQYALTWMIESLAWLGNMDPGLPGPHVRYATNVFSIRVTICNRLWRMKLRLTLLHRCLAHH